MNKTLESVLANPTRRILRNGCFSEISAVLQSFRPRNILLVLGEKSFRISPYYARLEEMLASYRVADAACVAPNPTQDFIQQEIEHIQGKNLDLVLAIGGGSVLDVGKILATIPQQEQVDLQRYVDGMPPITSPSLPLVVLPTTAGTGSEVTPYASLETKEKKKVTIQHASFYPTVALIDPEMCYSMPVYITASTGFDSLSQAIESFWSIHATPSSQAHSLRALASVLKGLVKACKDPLLAQARFDMSFASCEAGLAIAQTKTTAVHSASYPMTTHFGVAHGHACAVTLASFVRFNAPVLQDAGHPLLTTFKVRDYEDMAKKIESLMDLVGLERSLSKLGVDGQGIELIVREGLRPDRAKNNPRPVSSEDLRRILLEIH